MRRQSGASDTDYMLAGMRQQKNGMPLESGIPFDPKLP
jgi:hypothetical protein